MKRVLFLTFLLYFAELFSQPCYKSTDLKTDLLRDRLCPGIMRADLSELYEKLQQIHPDLYRYTSKHQIDAAYQRAFKRCKVSLSTYAFSKVLMEFLSELKDSHTSVNPYDFMSNNFFKRHYLPFTVALVDNQFVITKSWENKIPVGAELLSINGKPINSLYKEAKQFSPMEGGAKKAQTEIAVDLLPMVTNLLMNRAQHTFSWVESKDTLSASLSSPFLWSVWKELSGESQRTITLVRTNGQATLTIRSFSVYHTGKFRKQLDDIFSALIANPPKQLIIDFRDNTGGYILLQEYLMSFFVPQGTKYKANYIYKRSEYDRFSELSSFQRWKFVHSAKKAPINSTLANEYRFYKSPFGSVDTVLNEPTLKNNKNLYFSGRCALLVNGMTMSAAANFTAWFKSTKRGLVFGSQVSGTNGGTFANPTEFFLENSGVSISISTMKVDLVPRDEQTLEAILPDVWIFPSKTNQKQWDDFPIQFIMNYKAE
jgi:C-terminal processing protease CtpA/Prc